MKTCPGMLCPKLGGVASPFSLAGLLNWGGAKTGNSRVDQNRDDQGRNGDWWVLETGERLVTKSFKKICLKVIQRLRIGDLPSCEVQVTNTKRVS